MKYLTFTLILLLKLTLTLEANAQLSTRDLQELCSEVKSDPSSENSAFCRAFFLGFTSGLTVGTYTPIKCMEDGFDLKIDDVALSYVEMVKETPALAKHMDETVTISLGVHFIDFFCKAKTE